MIKGVALGLAAGLLALLWGADANAGARLTAIKARGHLACGVGNSVAGFSKPDAQGIWQGFDADLCRAVAAAIFGDARKVTFTPIATLPNFLKDDSIDLVLRGLTWTFGREARSELRFGPIAFYDGETFLTKKTLKAETAADLSGKTICVSSDVEFVPTLQYYFRTHDLQLKALVTDTRAEAEDAFFAGRCEAMTADASELAEAMIAKAPNPDDFVILPGEITKEPLAPLLRKGDDQFFDIVRWTLFALIDAEELGLTAANIENMRASDDPDIRRFLAAGDVGAAPMASDWTKSVVKSVGNYGEIYERHFGAMSRARLFRGLNRLWTAGGLMYAPPVR